MSTYTPVLITPPLGARGLYTLREPFTAPVDQLYKCIAIRKFKDFVDIGEDVYQKFYAPLQIEEAIYLADKAAGASIVTLQSDTSTTIYVPDTFVARMPDLTAVAYKRVVLTIELPPIPDTVDLTHLKASLAEVASDVTGVTPEVNEHVAPYTGVLSAANHEVAELARAAAVTNRETSYAKLVNAQETINSLLTKVEGLEAYMLAQQ